MELSSNYFNLITIKLFSSWKGQYYVLTEIPLTWIQICLPYTQYFCQNDHLWTYRMPYDHQGILYSIAFDQRTHFSAKKKSVIMGLWSWNSLVLPHSPLSWRSWLSEWSTENSVTGPARWKYLERLKHGSTEGCIYSESVAKRRCYFTYSHDSQVQKSRD